MKAPVLLLLILSSAISYTQGVFTNQTHLALQKVIGDYPNNFRNIKGNKVSEDPQSTDYNSSVSIPGQLNSVITKYNSSDDKEIYSWKSVLLETDDFDEVSKKYNEVYKQIKNSIIKIDGEKPFILSGSYEAPSDSKKFTNTDFYLLPASSGDLKRLKVELSLQFFVTEWKLAILVYDQDVERVVME
jgi:hypothetical protein